MSGLDVLTGFVALSSFAGIALVFTGFVAFAYYQLRGVVQ